MSLLSNVSEHIACEPDGVGTSSEYRFPCCPEMITPENLDQTELMAAYASHEPYVGEIVRVLLDMTDDQRRMSLALIQCLSCSDSRGAAGT